MFSHKKSWRLLLIFVFSVMFMFSGISGLALISDSSTAHASAEPDCAYDYTSDNDVDGEDLYEFIQEYNAGEVYAVATAFGSVCASGCRALLPCRVVEANQCFETALESDPDPVLKTFHAVTRILAIVGDESITTLLADLGMEGSLQNFCNLTAYWPQDEYENVLFPDDMPSTGTALNTVITALLAQINAALDEIADIDESIDEPFIVLCEELMLPDDDGQCEEIEVDYGDIAFYRAFLQGLKTFLLIVDAYNLDVAQTSALLQAMQEDILVINDYLCDGGGSCLPDFLTLDANGAAQLAQAKSSLNAAIDSYMEASAFIRDESDDQDDDLITIAPYSQDAADEADFRRGLEEIQSALSEPVTITGFGSEDNPFMLDLTPLFDTETPFVFRDYLPEFTEDNEIICDTVKPTLGGLLPGFDYGHWAEMLGLDVPVSGTVTADGYTGGNIYVNAFLATSLDLSSLMYSSVACSTVLSVPGDYELELSADLDSVCMLAYWDKDGSGQLSPGDTYGMYANNPFGIEAVDCDGPGDINITLDQTVHGISGRVTGGGVPLANAWVSVYKSGCGYYLGGVRTDSDGSFVFNTSWTGSVSLHVYNPYPYMNGWWTGTGVFWDCSLAASFDAGSGDVFIDISTISGTVISDSNRQPIGGLWVHAWNSETGDWAGAAETDGFGRYSITGLANGRYVVWVATDNSIYQSEYFDNVQNKAYATPVTITTNQKTRDNIDFSLEQIE